MHQLSDLQVSLDFLFLSVVLVFPEALEGVPVGHWQTDDNGLSRDPDGVTPGSAPPTPARNKHQGWLYKLSWLLMYHSQGLGAGRGQGPFLGGGGRQEEASPHHIVSKPRKNGCLISRSAAVHGLEGEHLSGPQPHMDSTSLIHLWRLRGTHGRWHGRPGAQTWKSDRSSTPITYPTAYQWWNLGK